MDFDVAKENIQPLKGGRNVERLGLALTAAEQKELRDELETQQKEYEEAIKSYSGSDPLAPWYDYISWIEQSYPKHGNDSPLDQAILNCILAFEEDPRYKQDRRMIKLYIKYIDTQENPHEMYQELYNQGIGTTCADLYIAWSYYYDAINNFKQTEAVFRKGLDACAQPYDELVQAHQSFSVSMSHRLLYDDETSKRQFMSDMEEKRHALTSLRGHKKKHVGSIRTGGVVKSEKPGIVNQENIPRNAQQSTSQFAVHEDDQLNATAPVNHSVIRSIIDSARKRENLHEAGPWSKAKLGVSKGGLFPTKSSPELGFTIPEDTETFEPIPYLVQTFQDGIKLPINHVTRNNPQTEWKIPLVIEDQMPPRAIPRYDKIMLYPKPGVEMSPEELRGYHFLKKQGTQNKFTKRCDKYWENSFEVGFRYPPAFASQNVEQDPDDIPRLILEEEHVNFQIPFKKIYPDGMNTEVSLDEMLVSKWKRGLMKMCQDDDSMDVDDMEETFVGARRQSIYPTRKSIMPRKSILSRKSVAPPEFKAEPELVESPEPAAPKIQQETRVKFNFEETPQPAKLESIRKSIVKRKIEGDGEATSSKTTNNTETPPRSVFAAPKFSDALFVKPQIPVRNPGIFEDDAGETKTHTGFDQNETCTTQQFNFFLQAQSVSTPIASRKPQRLCPDIMAVRTPSPEPQPSPKVAVVSPNPPASEQTNSQQATLQQKQLSTIYETTETTHSTKSSMDSPENEDQQTMKKSTVNTAKLLPIMETSFKMFDDKTETVPNILLKSIRAVPFESFKLPEPSARIPGLPEVSMKMPENSFRVPDLTENFSKLPELSMKLPEPMSPELSEKPKPATSAFNFEIFEDKDVEVAKTAVKEAEKSRLLQEIPVVPVRPVEDTMSSLYMLPDDLTVQQMEMKMEKEKEKAKEAAGKLKSLSESLKMEKSPEILSDSPEIPKVQESSVKFPIFQDESLKLPVVSAASPELPQIQEKSLHISSSQIGQESTSKIQEDPSKSAQLPFEIFVDRTETQARALLVKQRDIEEPRTDFQKENFFQPTVQTTDHFSDLLDEKTGNGRKISDEFYAMTKTPVRISKAKPNNVVLSQNSLKFDDEPGPFHIENAMHISNFEKSDSLIPVSQIKQEKSVDIEASLPALVEPDLDSDFNNLSISMDDEELKSLMIPSEKVAELKVPSPAEVFKVPELPFKKPAEKKKQVKVVEEINEEPDIDDDMSKSIYVQRPVMLPETPEKWEEISEDFQQSFVEQDNCYQHSMTECDFDEKDIREMMEAEDNNPFSGNLHNMMLEKCNFVNYLDSHIEGCLMLNKIKPLARGDQIACGKNGKMEFLVEKLIGKGTYGSIFKARCSETNQLYALKQERPANMWEYYINLELFSRLKNKDMFPGFMQIEYALIANNASVFASRFSTYGSLIDVCNKVKARTNRNVDEYVAMVLTTHILSIIDHLHSCKIIHADCKPDNFLLMEEIRFGSKVPALQLIDFGVAIDLDWYEEDHNFNYVVKTENFTCTEMMDNRPWTYQTDLFGVAGTAHVLLLGKYMDVKKRGMHYDISSRLPRYFNRDVWENFFHNLLNIKSCKELPNLQELKNRFDETLLEKEKFVRNKIDEFNNALR